jgi:hypothetical protein
LREEKHWTLGDVGRGAFTWLSDMRYHSLEDLQAGEEMFISYGPNWFEQAEKKYLSNLKNTMRRLIKSYNNLQSSSGAVLRSTKKY